MSEEKTQEQLEQEEATKQEEQIKSNLAKALEKFPNAPSQEEIDQWKTKFGEVFASSAGGEEIYVWRPINRAEWTELQSQAQDEKNPMTDAMWKEQVCSQCVLWAPDGEKFLHGKAGTPETLHEQIMQNSNFMSPQMASMLVIKL